jgi:hypothetical protein
MAEKLIVTDGGELTRESNAPASQNLHLQVEFLETTSMRDDKSRRVLVQNLL